MNALAGITVLVLGLGESGLAMARWCARGGATVRAWDSRLSADASADNAALPQAANLHAAVPDAQLITGALDAAAAMDGVQMVLKSPGLAPLDACIAPVLALAAQRGVPVQGELDLFSRALADLKAQRGYAPKVIAITGTNGKTTTTAMTALLVECAGRSVAVAGNIGPTLLGTLTEALEREADGSTEPVDGSADAEAALPKVWVLELSSFQLDGVSGFEPDAAAVLNLTDDHLDWHGSMAHYAAAKARVWGRSAVMVVNRDDPQVESLAAAAQAVATAASVAAAKPGAAARAARLLTRAAVRFGTDAPREPGDYGLITDNGMTWLVRALEADDSAAPKRLRAGEPAEREPLHIQHLMPVDALRVRGRHNAANALAALALAHAIGCPLAPMLHGLREYAGEPHRVAHVATIHGVDAFDDSKGTNVGATVAALEGLGADRAPGRLVVILGGDGKGQDFAPLAAPVQRHARAVATLGRDAPIIEAALVGIDELPLQRHATLEAATRWAFAQARSGDAVLLSPACASLDMFRNYAHRAEVFVAEVQAIAADAGVPA
ncbi:MAG: UDP-N-acetylmuramoyl-L-alanine--D-glutamate ligase [Burkholderiales bacterium 28-67-8]|nr:MAG: UDP-N-acetylmuramoyl-L-alanine--D-glutamate ligase [Burkholderiales bacterium 28-67-8]